MNFNRDFLLFLTSNRKIRENNSVKTIFHAIRAPFRSFLNSVQIHIFAMKSRYKILIRNSALHLGRVYKNCHSLFDCPYKLLIDRLNLCKFASHKLVINTVSYNQATDKYKKAGVNRLSDYLFNVKND